MSVENPYSYGGRNNSKAYSSFTHRLPRFEYRAAPFAFTVTVVGAQCGDDYPNDRRGPPIESDATLEAGPAFCSFEENSEGDIFLETEFTAEVQPGSIPAENMVVVQEWTFPPGLVFTVESVPPEATVVMNSGSIGVTADLGDVRTSDDGPYLLSVRLKVDREASEGGDFDIGVTTYTDADNATRDSYEGANTCDYDVSVCPIVEAFSEDFNSYENGSIKTLDAPCDDGYIIGIWSDLVTEDFNTYDDGAIEEFTDVQEAEWAFVFGQQPPLVITADTEFIMPENVDTLTVLMVAGGGGGGSGGGSGGGAGGVKKFEYKIGDGEDEFDIQAGDKFQITIGAGGAGGEVPGGFGETGGNTSFVHLDGGVINDTVFGGGAWKGSPASAAGGSGAGARPSGCAPCGQVELGGSGIPGQGNNGVSATYGGDPCETSEGEEGCRGQLGVAGGGAGTSSSSGDPLGGGQGEFFEEYEFLRIGDPDGWLGGGGGGGGFCATGTLFACGTCGAGGQGGGGQGTNDPYCSGSPGVDGTGGGGGGSKSANTPGGKGGDGIMIIDWTEIGA